MLCLQGVPALCLESVFAAVASDEGAAFVGLGDVADDAYVFECRDGVVLREWHGEEQFVVFASVQGTGADVQVQFFGHRGGLVVEGQTLLVDAAACLALLADVH